MLGATEEDESACEERSSLTDEIAAGLVDHRERDATWAKNGQRDCGPGPLHRIKRVFHRKRRPPGDSSDHRPRPPPIAAAFDETDKIEENGDGDKYRLALEEWKEIDACWMTNYNHTVACPRARCVLPRSFHNDRAQGPPVTTELPSRGQGFNRGKFPELGDQDIVGPMTQNFQAPQPGRFARWSGSSRLFSS
ncbi:MAG: hypothetical protein M1826_002329 [Phylliscum demangeonii]|nr:MAG: hypothetical protein M1826_002329 [Phylliscum demangeonii]